MNPKYIGFEIQHDGHYEEYYFLVCDAVYSGSSLPMI
jgi:hypothetical protein